MEFHLISSHTRVYSLQMYTYIQLLNGLHIKFVWTKYKYSRVWIFRGKPSVIDALRLLRLL